jgi:hypothetical protein
MNKIKNVSLIFRILFQAIFCGLIFIQIMGWIYVPTENILLNVIPHSYQGYVQNIIHLNAKIAGFCVTAIPTMFKLLTFYYLIKLLRLYEHLVFFSEDNVRYIKNAGYSLLMLQLINPVCEFLLGFILTADNPPGFRFAKISITEWNIELILTALIIILTSWIMAEGCKLLNDQRLTI